MTNPFYAATDSIVRFTRANASVVQGEFTKIEQAFDSVNIAFSENRDSATSTSSVAIGTGSKSFLATTYRRFSPGQFVIAAASAAVANYMLGQITAYDSETGYLTLNVLSAEGSGTFASWTLSLSANSSQAGVITGQLLVGTATSPYKADVNGTMRVVGAFTLDDDLNVSGTVTSSNLLLQGDGTDGYVRPTNVGSYLYLGANNINIVTITSAGAAVSGTLNATGAVALGSTLGVTGTTTLEAVNATDGAFSGTLFVTGNTGIGGAPARKLDVFGTFGVTSAVTLGSTLDVTGAVTFGSTLTATGTANLANTNVTGYVTAQVGSGSTSPIVGVSNLSALPSASFTNNGTGPAVFGVTSSISSGGGNNLSYHYAGITQGLSIWYLYGTGATSYTSDARTKKNIKPARTNYLEDIMRLEVVKFDRRTPEEIDLDADEPICLHADGDPEPKEIGLLASQVAEVFPSIVEDALHDLDGNLYELDGEGNPLVDEDGNPVFSQKTKSKVIKGDIVYGPIMLASFQELVREVTALKAQVAALEA